MLLNARSDAETRRTCGRRFQTPEPDAQALPVLPRRDGTWPSSSIETFFDSLVEQQNIPNIFSMQMCGAGLPTTGEGSNGGSLVMGGIEPSLYTGEIWYTPITEEWYYQVEVLKFEVGGLNLNLGCTEYNSDKAIVDSGTTLLRLPDKVFNAVVEGIIQTSLIENFNNEFWTGLQLACWEKTEEPWAYFPDISIYLRDMNASMSFRLDIKPQVQCFFFF
ncbi:unnamed protein product [Ranitomeya imitator]|uniref:Peptidase A1 domain-containing protein n=1 Tax=Ranitomeya imitator TaxID=111125 RepID=A0ABN9L230_9NEOB|nr:unnamed protein product [Ranitomeya imitator]